MTVVVAGDMTPWSSPRLWAGLAEVVTEWTWRWTCRWDVVIWAVETWVVVTWVVVTWAEETWDGVETEACGIEA